MKPYTHTRIIDSRLMRLFEDGREHNYLQISQPPRTGKTSMALIFGATQYLANHPDHHVFVISSSQQQANRFGRAAKNVFGSFAEEIWGLRIDRRLRGQASWGIEGHEGTFNSMGWGGPLSGNKVHLLIMDDLIKGTKDAMSPVMRQDLWDWWEGTAAQRVQDNEEIQTKVLSIQCLVGRTPVIMADFDVKNLADIQPGDEVLSYNESTQKIEPDTVEAIRSCGLDDCLTVNSLIGGPITGNARHPFLVAGFEGHQWLELGSLKPGHMAVCANWSEWSKLNGLVYTAINSLEPAGRQEVFDLQIRRNASFLVGSGYIVHNTRWHVDDLNGKLIQQENAGGMKWDKLFLPALADRGPIYDTETGELIMDHGQPLCEEILSLAMCEHIRTTRSRYWWESLYQQRPITQDGLLWESTLFPAEKFVDGWPERLKYLVVGVDPATGTALSDGDYTAFVALGVGFDGLVYVQADMEKSGPSESVARLEQFCEQLPMIPDVIAFEAQGFATLLTAMTAKHFQAQGLSSRFVDYKINERNVPLKKTDRIPEIDPLIRDPLLRYIRGRGTQLLVSQLMSFPNKQSHDDGPDALELASWVLIDTFYH